MSIFTFKELMRKIPNNLTQIAFGIGDIDANPDLQKIILYTRELGIVPNITINGYRMTGGWYNFLSTNCGAVAVSQYEDDVCFDAVNKLTDLGMKQVNIHKVLTKETYDSCFDLISKAKTDSRLKNLNAVVFLALKKKGLGKNVEGLGSIEKFKKLVEYAFENKIKIGFDSCSAPNFLKAMEEKEDIKKYITVMEPCESGLFSFYGNVKGEYFPCSFMEGVGEWKSGIDGIYIKDFIGEVWFNEKLVSWREKLLSSSKKCNCNLKKFCRSCPVYSETSFCKGE
jgi:hypothetical protein